MSNYIVLRVNQNRVPDGTRRTIHLSGLADLKHSELEIHFDLINEFDIPEPSVWDGFVGAVVQYAMSLRQDLVVKGSLSRTFFRRLSYFQSVWDVTEPKLYNKIRVIPETVIEDRYLQKKENALAAFSGGVDSTYTVLKQAKLLGQESYPLNSHVLLVHGADVMLHNNKGFAALEDRVKPFLDDIGLQLKTCRTNMKELKITKWEQTYYAMLACCLQNYAHDFGYGLFASAKRYDNIVLPMGSNAIIDPLLSSAVMEMVHDGAESSRTEKVEKILQHPLAVKTLRFCWANPSVAQNCGKCEKCIRTRLNFLVAGMPNPSCFDEPFDPNVVRTLRIDKHDQEVEILSILRLAKERGIKGKWIRETWKLVCLYRLEYWILRKILPAKVSTAIMFMLRGEWAIFWRSCLKNLRN